MFITLPLKKSLNTKFLTSKMQQPSKFKLHDCNAYKSTALFIAKTSKFICNSKVLYSLLSMIVAILY